MRHLYDTIARHRGRKRGRVGKSPAFRNKVHRVMSEFKHGALHSGSHSGPVVTSRKQAIRIALEEARRHTQG